MQKPSITTNVWLFCGGFSAELLDIEGARKFPPDLQRNLFLSEFWNQVKILASIGVMPLNYQEIVKKYYKPQLLKLENAQKFYFQNQIIKIDHCASRGQQAGSIDRGLA